MTPDEWRRVKTITAEALERPAPERLAFVAAECGSDDRLRDEVWSLLAASEKAAMLYEAPMFQLGNVQAVVTDLERAASPLIGQRIGPYKVVRELGRGGMGAAYLAERADETFERLVAIKLIKRGMDTDAILRRFRHERRILANLNHPNIATLLDGGTTDDDRPYFVMEYIDGLPIDVFCDQHQRSVRDRLELFRQVCAAVHYAHRNRVVHRDLKPANILVTADGIPKLLDFGIAKLLGSDEDLLTVETTVTARAMTPQYASPEQLRGEPITPSSDVYSLGILLYRLVAGRLPYRLDGCTPTQAERVVCEEDPPRPSAVLGDTARTPEERRWRRDVQGNVDAIVMTALRKRPERRYPSVQALADDVERHLGGLPIAARQPGVRDRVRTFARRMSTNRRVGTVAAVLVVLLSVAAVSSLVQRRLNLTTASTIESLAVLPITNVQRNGELDFLAEGMTDGLINRLSNVPRLKVIARDSVYRYSGSAADYGEIARQLGVGAVLTGGIASNGSHVQVTVELINAREQRRLWARRYDRPLGDMQVLQAEVTQEVVDHLQLQFSGPEQTRSRRVFTTDSEAYQLYLKGRYVWNKRRVDDFRKSIGYFQQALAEIRASRSPIQGSPIPTAFSPNTTPSRRLAPTNRRSAQRRRRWRSTRDLPKRPRRSRISMNSTNGIGAPLNAAISGRSRSTRTTRPRISGSPNSCRRWGATTRRWRRSGGQSNSIRCRSSSTRSKPTCCTWRAGTTTRSRNAGKSSRWMRSFPKSTST